MDLCAITIDNNNSEEVLLLHKNKIKEKMLFSAFSNKPEEQGTLIIKNNPP